MNYQVGDEILLREFLNYRDKRFVIRDVICNMVGTTVYVIRSNEYLVKKVTEDYIDHEKTLQLKREKILSLL